MSALYANPKIYLLSFYTKSLICFPLLLRVYGRFRPCSHEKLERILYFLSSFRMSLSFFSRLKGKKEGKIRENKNNVIHKLHVLLPSNLENRSLYDLP